MNEWLNNCALIWPRPNPDKAACGQAELAILRCSVNCELGTLPPGKIENAGMSPGNSLPSGVAQILHRFIMNECALCYPWLCVCMSVCLSVCLYVTKCIVTKLQMLQTSPMAQIYLLAM
jgi:hypothetical protein